MKILSVLREYPATVVPRYLTIAVDELERFDITNTRVLREGLRKLAQRIAPALEELELARNSLHVLPREISTDVVLIGLTMSRDGEGMDTCVWSVKGETKEQAREAMLIAGLNPDGGRCGCSHDCCNCGFSWPAGYEMDRGYFTVTQRSGRNI